MSLAGTETKTADAGDDDTVYIDGKPFKIQLNTHKSATSWVWSTGNVKRFTDKSKASSAWCTVCLKEILYKGSLGNLTRHFFHNHRDIWENHESEKFDPSFGTLDKHVVYGGSFMKY
mmetsp:Transcript_14275/g.23738  ORF Transcript_14275/g.23738 Transcript_14275/m.23738 type:complete len:117 (-) Transcript_14275:150-500(-)